MSMCKKLVDGICTHYNAADPPEHICKECRYREVPAPSDCPHKDDDGWCYKYVAGERYPHHWKRTELCNDCKW